MSDAPLETLASQLTDLVGSHDEAKVEAVTMAVRLDVAVVRLEAALNTFSREIGRLRRAATLETMSANSRSDDAGAARAPLPDCSKTSERG